MKIQNLVVAVLFCFGLILAAEAGTDNPFLPAEKNIGRWVWIPIDTSICRDGSKTGIGVRLQPNAKGLMIYLQGGGACYDGKSCAENEKAAVAGKKYGAADFAKWTSALGNQGMFNTGKASNPVRDWNHVYVPYCTGDLHGGRKRNGRVKGVPGLQQFTGHQNVSSYLDVIGPYFGDAGEVVLAGASAGGFGVMINYPQVSNEFNSVPVTALVDAAPIVKSQTVKLSCLQGKMFDAFDPEMPKNCSDCRNVGKGGMLNLYGYLSKSYPKGRFGFATADADIVGVMLLNRESKSCGGAGVNIFNYRRMMLGLRDDVLKPTGNWSTFYWGGLQHTMTQSNTLFLNHKVKRTTGGEWFRRIMAGETLHIAP